MNTTKLVIKPATIVSPVYRSGSKGCACVLCGKYPAMYCHLPANGYGADQGWATKCHDVIGADLCYECHYKFDEGEYRKDFAMRFKALSLTIERRLKQGLLFIPGEHHADDPDGCPF